MQQSDKTTKLILRLAAVATGALGLTILLVPQLVIHWFDGYSLHNNYHFVRFVGAALVGFGVMNWVASKSRYLPDVLPIMYGNLTSLTLAIIIDVIGLATHMLSSPTWLILGLHIVFAAAFTYGICLMKNCLKQADA